jgi:hypothetical protein
MSSADFIVMALALALNYDTDFSGWPIAIILLLTAVFPTLRPVRLTVRVPSLCL